MNKKLFFILPILFLFILTSCSNQPKNKDELDSQKKNILLFDYKNTINALNNHVMGTPPRWQLVMSQEYNNYVKEINNICNKSGVSKENLNMINYLIEKKGDANQCIRGHENVYGNNAQFFRGDLQYALNQKSGATADSCFPTYDLSSFKNAKSRAGYSNNCTAAIDELTNSTTHMFNNIKISSVLKEHDKELIKILINKEQIVKQERMLVEKKNMDAFNDIRKKEQDNKNRQREQCLSNGAIGICQSSSQNKLQNICSADANPFSALANSLNEYCYITDQFNISSKMEVRNNTNKTIKDIVFSCQQQARSGTVLITNNLTIYDVWNSNQSKIISLKFLKHQQVESMTCKEVGWK